MSLETEKKKKTHWFWWQAPCARWLRLWSYHALKFSLHHSLTALREKRRGERRGERVGITGRFDLARGRKERLFLPQKPLWDFALVSQCIRISYLQLEWMQHSIQTTEAFWWGSAFYIPYLFIWLKVVLHLPTLYVLCFKWKKGTFVVCVLCSWICMELLSTNLCGGKICKFDWFLCFRGKSISLTSLLCSRMFLSFMRRCSKSWLPPYSELLHLFYYTMLWCCDWGTMNGW